jgi:hypothetical protein
MSIHDAARPAEPRTAAPGEPGADASALPGRAGDLARRVPQRLRLPLATYLACQAIFLAWWAAFYPALMTYDSAVYIQHVTTGPWVDNHSVLYDSLIWLSLHLTGNLAAVTLAQTVAMSAALAYTVAAFRRLGVPGRWTAIAAVIVAVLPSTGMVMIYLWKDVPYVICAFLIVPTLAHLISLRGLPGWRRDRRVNALIAVLGLEMLGMSLFRINGFTIVALAAIPLVALFRGARAKLAAAAVSAICLALLLNLVVYPAAGIQRPPGALAYGPAYADIAVAYSKRPLTFTRADKRAMTQVAPLAKWDRSANCYNSGPTDALPGFGPRRFTAKMSSQLVALWLRVLIRSPQLVLGARICRGSIAWSIFQGRIRRQAETVTPADSVLPYLPVMMSDNPYHADVGTRPLSGILNRVAGALWRHSKISQLDWLLWRGALWCYLSYLVLFAFARARRNWALLSLGAIVVGQQAGILATVPAQVFRYMLAPIIIGIMLVPLFFARNRPAPQISDS